MGQMKPGSLPSDKESLPIDKMARYSYQNEIMQKMMNMHIDAMKYSLQPGMFLANWEDVFIDPLDSGRTLSIPLRNWPITHWTTEDGRVLKITEMEPTHLENSIAHLDERIKRFKGTKLEHKIDGWTKIQTAMRDELKSRGFKYPVSMEITT